MIGRYFCAFFLISASVTTVSENSNCVKEISVNVMLPTVALVRNLKADNFVAERNRGTLPIQSFTVDTSPRRIIFVVETGKDIPEAARKIQMSVLSSMLSNARSEDSFALLTAHGPRKEVRFGASSDTLRSAIGELAERPDGKTQTTGTLDAVLECASWFQRPRPGDTIVVMTVHFEGPSRTSYSKVRDALTTASIRLFGFQLGKVLAGYYSVGIAPTGRGGVIPTASISPNEETLFDLSDATGGMVFGEDVTGLMRTYKLSDARLKILSDLGGQIYKAVTNYYLLRLEAPTRGLQLSLSDAVRAQFPNAKVLYPKINPSCSPYVVPGESVPSARLE